MRDNISRYVTSMAVQDEEAMCLWVLQPRLRLEDGSQPLVRIAVGRSATVTGRELPVARRMAGIQAVLVCCALKMIRGGIAAPAALTHSMAVIHSCRPTMTFQIASSLTHTDALED